MSISTNFPTIKPSLNLDFANTGALDPRVTFTRASTATYYDGVTTAKAEQNLLTYSQEFDNAAWVNLGTTDTANSTAAPDGTSTADTLDDGVGTSGHDIAEGFVGGTAGVTYTLSAFFKNVDRQYVILACSAGTNTWASAKFDLTAGTVGSTSAAGSGWSTTSSSIASVGNSWFRCTITFVSGSTGTLSARLGMATDGTTFTAAQRGLESYTGTNKQIYIWGAQLEQRSSVTAYTPTTTQPITNYIPVLQTAAANVARFDHNPTTSEALGLLIEEQRTNLLTYSSDFSDASWTKTNSSVSPNEITAPDGSITGTLFTADGTSTTPFVGKGIGTSSQFTVSIYVKQGGFLPAAYLHIYVATNNTFVCWRLSDGVQVSQGAGSGVINAKPNGVYIGNGWWRYSATITPTGSYTIRYCLLSTQSSAWNPTEETQCTGYIWGAQLEAGAFPTSYIATTSAQVTRSADAASMTGTNFSSWYNQGEGTAYAEAQINFAPIGAGGAPFYSIDNVSTNIIQPYFSNTSGILFTYITVNNVMQSNTGNTVIQQGQMFKHAQAYQVNNFASVVNNGTVSTDTSGIVPTVTQIRFTYGVKSTYFKKFAYYPQRLTNAQLQSLTS